MNKQISYPFKILKEVNYVSVPYICILRNFSKSIQTNGKYFGYLPLSKLGFLSRS